MNTYEVVECQTRRAKFLIDICAKFNDGDIEPSVACAALVTAGVDEVLVEGLMVDLVHRKKSQEQNVDEATNQD